MIGVKFEARPGARRGAGINLTLISKVRLAGGDASLESRSTVKKVQIRTDVGLLTTGEARTETAKGLNPAHDNVGTFKIDPLLFSIGFGKRF